MLPVIPLELQGKTHQLFSMAQPFGLRCGRKGRGIRINPLNGVVQEGRLRHGVWPFHYLIMVKIRPFSLFLSAGSMTEGLGWLSIGNCKK